MFNSCFFCIASRIMKRRGDDEQEVDPSLKRLATAIPISDSFPLEHNESEKATLEIIRPENTLLETASSKIQITPVSYMHEVVLVKHDSEQIQNGISDQSSVGLQFFNGYWVPNTCSREILRLARENSHPRDSSIAFDEGPHLYYINGECNFRSVTTFIHDHFNEFDKDLTATRMIRRKDFWNCDRYSKYYPMSVDTESGQPVPERTFVDRIIASWDQNASEQSSLGTKMHRNIELFYNGEPHDTASTEFGYFLSFHESVSSLGWEMFRTEMTIWEETSRLCGSVDAIYVNTRKVPKVTLQEWSRGGPVLHVQLIDWKRSKEITMNGFNKFGKPPCAQQLEDCNFNHYKLQLNLYKYILELRYNMIVDSMAIVVCHPDNNNKSFLKYEMPSCQDMISRMVHERTASLANKHASLVTL